MTSYEKQNRILTELLKKSDGVSDRYTSNLDEINQSLKELKKSNEILSKKIEQLEQITKKSRSWLLNIFIFIGGIFITLIFLYCNNRYWVNV
jgi:predicted PurR-regulated permease PerM